MPRLVAVLSDVHANRQALEAVLAAADAAGADERWCLGDLVGYGADPVACVDLILERCARVLAGNHDLAVTGAVAMGDFSANAAAAARWTIGELDAARVSALARLLPIDNSAPVGLYHGSPRDPVWEYVMSTAQAAAALDRQDRPVGLVGHTHVACQFVRLEPGGLTRGRPCHDGDEADLAIGEHLLNPGSVGQPRDGDPRAAWMLLDLESESATWRRTSYDVEGAQDAIRAAGLPASLAERLGYGQ